MSEEAPSASGPRLLERLEDETHLWIVRLRESIPPERNAPTFATL